MPRPRKGGSEPRLFRGERWKYVPLEAPVRAYDAFVEALDFEELGLKEDEEGVGNPEHNPRAMLKLLLYGYSYGVRSSRKLEREAHYNLSFIWLMGGLRPDHKTIAEFRRKNKDALKKVLKQCVRMYMKLDLIEGNTLFLDGTKIRANASIKNTWTEARCERVLKHIDERIEAILAESERLDSEEEGSASLVSMAKELGEGEVLRAKVKEILGTLKETEMESVKTTDVECARFRSAQGSHMGYNAQLVVDDKKGLIVSSDVVAENNDLEQFAAQVVKAQEVLDKKCRVACADAGYAATDKLEKVDEDRIKVVVPSQRQAGGQEKNPFDKSHFRYDAQRDVYICPEGKELVPRCRREHGVAYRIRERRSCLRCRHYGVCTKSKTGREVERMHKEEVKERLEAQYKASEAIYKKRKEKVELPFGHIKRNLGVQAFLLRGLEGARGEMGLLASCFDIRRMMSLLGVRKMVEFLGG